MRKSEKTSKSADVPDIDFSGGVRGKYAARFAAGTNVVVLSPDVAEVFPDSMAVNGGAEDPSAAFRQDGEDLDGSKEAWELSTASRK